MHVVAELSGMTTAKNFDCVGASSKFGDNMVTLSAGLSFTLGKVGYKRIVDANPYMAQNEWLIAYADRLADSLLTETAALPKSTRRTNASRLSIERSWR